MFGFRHLQILTLLCLVVPGFGIVVAAGDAQAPCVASHSLEDAQDDHRDGRRDPVGTMTDIPIGSHLIPYLIWPFNHEDRVRVVEDHALYHADLSPTDILHQEYVLTSEGLTVRAGFAGTPARTTNSVTGSTEAPAYQFYLPFTHPEYEGLYAFWMRMGYPGDAGFGDYEHIFFGKLDTYLNVTWDGADMTFTIPTDDLNVLADSGYTLGLGGFPSWLSTSHYRQEAIDGGYVGSDRDSLSDSTSFRPFCQS